MKKLIRIHENDNVAVAVSELAAGVEVSEDGITLKLNQQVPTGHKVAIAPIASGEQVIKYGFCIGLAREDIAAGDYVHSHNVRTALEGSGEFVYEPSFKPVEKSAARTFMGYKRMDGNVGVRNDVWVIPTVGCVNKIAKLMTRELEKELPDNVDGLHVFEHPFGCSQLGDDHLTTQKILAGLVQNPNAGAVLVLGLGCENNQVGDFKKVLGDYDDQRVKFLITQEVDDEIESGINVLKELIAYASTFARSECDVSKLKIGLKCGGSDAFSGITANPLLGAFSDMLVACGGTSALTEIPEMFGAEGIILNRCVDKDIFAKGAGMVNDFRDYYISHGEPVSENPSPGNRAGGITTLEDKSLGCVQKGGTSPVVEVLHYGEQLSREGLAIVEGPGNDLVAVTNLAAAGCQIVLFTTGRGNPFGGAVPTIKVSTNSDLAKRKKHWIDFDAGALLSGESMSDLASKFFDYILAVAGGELTCNEKNGCVEISIFKSGVTL